MRGLKRGENKEPNKADACKHAALLTKPATATQEERPANSNLDPRI
jgi:hypothetical protein